MLGNFFKLSKELIERWKWTRKADRLGPDMISTNLLFYIPSLQKKVCNEKFLFFGENTEFRKGAYAVYCSNISLGNNVVIRPNSVLMATDKGNITIEKDVLIGSGVHIYVANHRYDDVTKSIYYQGHSDAKAVLIKEGSWIGSNVVILPGVTVGKNAVVAAGSIVTKDIDDFTIFGGVPAKFIKKIT